MDDGAPSTVTPPSMPGVAAAPDSKRAPGARPRARVGRAFLVAAVGALILALVVAFMERGAPRHPPIDLDHRTAGELVSPDELRDRAARAAAGQQPYADAVADL